MHIQDSLAGVQHSLLAELQGTDPLFEGSLEKMSPCPQFFFGFQAERYSEHWHENRWAEKFLGCQIILKMPPFSFSMLSGIHYPQRVCPKGGLHATEPWGNTVFTGSVQNPLGGLHHRLLYLPEFSAERREGSFCVLP